MVTSQGEIGELCCDDMLPAGPPFPARQAIELTRTLKALADPVRFRLLSLIAAQGGGEVCVCDLVATFDLTQPTISHHLRILREAGLVESKRRGTWVFYRSRPESLQALKDALESLTLTAVPA
jgi:ArsR family transcriptional regulator